MSNWQEASLADLADYINGRAIKPEECSAYQGIPVIRIKQINDPQSIEDLFCGDDLDEKNIARPGDLLFSWSATLKTILWQGSAGAINQHIFKVLPRDGIDKTFLHYLIDHSIPALSEESHGSTMKHIKKSALSELRLQIPTTDEQKKIAEILSRVDRVVDRLSGKLAKQQTLLGALLDDQFSLNAENEEALLEDISEYITYGLTVRPKYVDHGVPMISAGECRNGYLDFDASKKISQVDFANVRSKTIPRQGDLLVTKTGTLGRVAVVQEDCPEFTITQNVALIRPLRNAVRSEYLAYYLRSPACQRKIREKTSVLAIPDLQLGMLGKFFIPLASASRQEEVSKFLISVENHIGLIRQELDALLLLKSSLASDLLSGRKRVCT